MIRRHGHLPRLTFLAADALGAGFAAGAAYWIRIASGWLPVTGEFEPLPERYLQALPVAVGAMLLSASVAGTYSDEALSRGTRFADALRVGAIAGAALATLALLYRDVFSYSRIAVAIAALVYVPVFLLGRAIAGRALAALRARGRLRTRAAVVGGGDPRTALRDTLTDHPWMGVDVVAELPIGASDPAWESATRLPDLEALRQLAQSGQVDEVYLALPAANAADLANVLRELDQVTANVRVIPDLGAAVRLNASAAVVAGLPIVSLRERPLYGARAAAKRALDIALASVLIVLTAPLMLLIAITLRLTSRGPAIFRQERMGLDARPFSMLKFRTMGLDAEKATGPVFAKPGDPRVTPLGRLLRRLSLDELPQLWNVLRGDMSLVGPRPEREPFIEEFRNLFPGYMLRHSVKSGMTGWAQVHGLRGGSSLEKRLRYDLEYIDRWSLSLDLEILGRTVMQVLVGNNAY